MVKIQPKDNNSFEQNSDICKNNHISCNNTLNPEHSNYLNKPCQALHFIIIILSYKLNVYLKLLWLFVFIFK